MLDHIIVCLFLMDHMLMSIMSIVNYDHIMMFINDNSNNIILTRLSCVFFHDETHVFVCV